MPHHVQLHKSDEGLMRKFFSIDTAKVATRTSSVRLKRQRRPADAVSKHTPTQPGYHLISNIRTTDVIDVETGIPHPRKASGPKIRRPPASVASSPVQKHHHPIVQTRPGRCYDGSRASRCDSGPECNGNGASTTATAKRTCGSIKVEKQDITLIHASQGAVPETLLTRCTAARIPHDKPIGVQVKSAEELQQEGWKLVRAAMQVEMDPGHDDGGDGPILHGRQQPRRAWKHAERNFFPAGSQHLDAEEVVRIVLGRHVKAGRVQEVFISGQYS
ncbi:hypothetical protein MMC15_006256 [Xylographa vitiligo]|nr:hypothetical protein [Xylographa vitiligo]